MPRLLETSPALKFARRLAVPLLLSACVPASQAAGPYAETWDGGTLAGWDAATVDSVLVNPGDHLVVQRQGSGVSGARTELKAATGDFSGSLWTVSVDLTRQLTPEEELLEAIFGPKPQDAWLRLRYGDSSFNGWRYLLTDKLDTDWTTYSVDFDPGWTDAEAGAQGWQTDLPDGSGSLSWAQTLQNVYQTSLRFELPNTRNIGVDNFSLSPVPEPGTWLLASLGLVTVGWRLRRLADAPH